MNDGFCRACRQRGASELDHKTMFFAADKPEWPPGLFICNVTAPKLLEMLERQKNATLADAQMTLPFSAEY